MANWLFLTRRLLSKLWLRASLFAVLSVAAALASTLLAPFVPPRVATGIGADAVDELLSIMASSMLPVATFSLATMIGAYSAASVGVTPRAAALLMEDKRAQNALSIFIGAFIYAVVGLVALRIGLYGQQGRAIMFGVTLAVVVAIVATLIRWVDELSRLGRVGETIDRIENATAAAMRRHIETERCATWRDMPVVDGHVLRAPTIGYVQHVDAEALGRIAEEHKRMLQVEAPTGTFCLPDTILARLEGDAPLGEETGDAIIRCFIIGDLRTFEQDPRFGFVVLSEVASRALSPAVNDPGTAIDIIGTGTRLLHEWDALLNEPDAGRPSCLFLRRQFVATDELFDDLFRPIARDGAGIAEVGIGLQKAFASLATCSRYRETARRHAAEALDRARPAMALPADFERVAAHAVGGAAR